MGLKGMQPVDSLERSINYQSAPVSQVCALSAQKKVIVNQCVQASSTCSGGGVSTAQGINRTTLEAYWAGYILSLSFNRNLQGSILIIQQSLKDVQRILLYHKQKNTNTRRIFSNVSFFLDRRMFFLLVDPQSKEFQNHQTKHAFTQTSLIVICFEKNR